MSEVGKTPAVSVPIWPEGKMVSLKSQIGPCVSSVRCINLHLRLLCCWKPPPIPCLLAVNVMFGSCLLVTSTAGWLSFFVTPLLEWAEHLEKSLGVHVAEILQICCDSPGLLQRLLEVQRSLCGRVWAAPSWSGREVSPECGFAAYLQEPGERKPQLPATCRREGDSAFASTSQCWFLILHFLCPWILWLTRNPPGSLPCLFTLLSSLCLDCWLLMLVQALWSREEVLWSGWEDLCSNPDSLECLQTVWEAGGWGDG